MSKKTEELRKKRQAAIDAAKAITLAAEQEEREVTDDELAQIQQFTAEAHECRDLIEAEQAKEQARLEALAALDEETSEADKPVSIYSHSKSKPTITGGDGAARFRDFGEYIHMLRTAETDPVVHGQLERKLQASSGLNTVIDSEGGFLIAPQFSSEILRKMWETGDVLSRVRQLPLSGNTYKVPYVNESSRAAGSRWGGVRGYWREEGGTVTATKPDFGQLELSLKSAMCLGYISEEQLEDYAATGSLLEQAFQEELTFLVEDAIINGDGSGKPLGILNSACTVSVAKETNQTAATVWGPNIVKMWARGYARGRNNAVWLVSQSVEPYLWSLALEGRYGSAATAVDAIPLYFPAGSVTNQGTYATLMGRPVIPVEYCAAVGTVGDILLADLSQYLLATKAGAGLKSDSSIHVRFLYNERTYRVSYRVDGEPWWSSAVTPANGGSTISPFVSLATR